MMSEVFQTKEDKVKQEVIYQGELLSQYGESAGTYL
jgi:hypothetical protein